MPRRFKKSSNGFYYINGAKYSRVNGSKAQVMHGTAFKTASGLTKNNLMRDSNGLYVARSKYTRTRHVRHRKTRRTRKVRRGLANRTRRWF